LETLQPVYHLEVVSTESLLDQNSGYLKTVEGLKLLMSPYSLTSRLGKFLDGRSAVQVEIGHITTLGVVFLVVVRHISTIIAIEYSLWSVLLAIAVVEEGSRIISNG